MAALPTGVGPFISVASGVGALDLGVEAGSDGRAWPVCYIENEVTAAGVLVTRMGEGAIPEAPLWSDAHTFGAKKWAGLVAGVVAGYPCQPFSTAGHRRGADDRRHLWPAISRIIEGSQPLWVFLENVAGHLRLGYFDHVRPDLERQGYRCSEIIVRAADVGAPQQRERLFILAYTPGIERLSAEEQGWSEDAGGEGEELADAHPEQRGHGYRAWRLREAWFQDQIRRSGGPDLPRADGPTFPPPPDGDWGAVNSQYWPVVESPFRGVVDGTPCGVGLSRPDQLRLLGNSVVPGQAALAWRILWGEVSRAGHP